MNKKIIFSILTAIAVIYAVIIIPTWNENYIDFGDGNYIYIAKRMAEGKMLYRDILAPQPPVHLYLGKALLKTGKMFGISSPLTPFRVYSMLLHIATFVLIFFTAKKMFKEDKSGIIAGLFYMIIPIGFWWTRGYQSEPTEVFFMMLSFWFFLDFTKKSMMIAAGFSIIAALTNMTAVPYVLFNLIFLIIRKRKLFLYYFLPFAAGMFLIMMFFELRTGRYFENVFVNQVGSYPNKEMYEGGAIPYAFSKLLREGKDVLFWEGIYIFECLLGMMKFIRKKEEPAEREYITFFTICALGSFVFVTKGGTMEYIFSIGEPWLCLFAGYYTWTFIAENLNYKKEEFFSAKDFSAAASVILLAVAVFVCCIIGLMNSFATLQEKNDELSAEKVQEIKFFIEKHSKPGDEILAPPFYAVVTDRPLYEDYSELFLWTIKYWNEVKVDKKPGLGTQKVQSIAKALNEKRIPIAVIERDQTGHIPEIAEALEKNYQWAPPLTKPYETLNTRLLIMIPKE